MMYNRIIILLSSLLFFCQTMAQNNCNCNPVGAFPAIINGITLTGTATGDVSAYYSAAVYCDLEAGPALLGRNKAFSYTITFSTPVNNVEYVLNWSEFGESFTFDVNKGILTAKQICGNCPYTQTKNTFIPEKQSSGSYYGASAGIIKLSSTQPYTSVTISGPGGQNGTLMGICINSISTDVKSAETAISLACNDNSPLTESFISTFSESKNDTISGKWTGSNTKGTQSELEIVQEGSKIKGFENIRFSDGSEALYSISGSIDGEKVEWTEDDPFPFEANLVNDIILCKTYNVFSLTSKNGRLYLTGTHTSIDKRAECHGISGDYCYVKKTAPVNITTANNAVPIQERKVVPVANLKLPEKKFTIVIWDDHKEDGDIVTLFLNGKAILENYTLENAPKEITLVCPDGENELVMQAESMGTSPPNTAAIKILCKDKTIKRLVLKSTDKTSQSLIIKSN